MPVIPPASAGVERSTSFPNHSLAGPLATIGGTFSVIWIITLTSAWLSFKQDPFEGFGNRASVVITSLTIIWVGCVLLFAWIATWVDMPRELVIGNDYVEGTPPRLYGNPPRPRHVVIHFEDIRKVGWGGLGPCVTAGPGSLRVRDPRDAALLLSFRNSRILRDRWTAWKGQQRTSPISVNRPIP